MRDKTDEEIKAERTKIIEVATKEYGEVEVIDSFFENAPHDARYLWFLAKSLELRATADIAFLPRGGKSTVVARLSMNALYSTALKLYVINRL